MTTVTQLIEFKQFLLFELVLAATGVGVRRREGDQVLVEGDGLMQPLPSLVKAVYSITNTQTISTVTWHSSS